MKRLTLAALIAAALALPATSVFAGSSSELLTQQRVQIRKELNRPANLNQPGIRNRLLATRAYINGRYHTAAQHYRTAARFGDKPSQLALGLLYLNGRGVAADPATAWAWLSLASSQDQPGYVATRDQVWSSLDAPQRDHARQVLASLEPAFADAVTQHRQINSNLMMAHSGPDTGMVVARMDADSHNWEQDSPIPGMIAGAPTKPAGQ